MPQNCAEICFILHSSLLQMDLMIHAPGQTPNADLVTRPVRDYRLLQTHPHHCYIHSDGLQPLNTHTAHRQHDNERTHNPFFSSGYI